VNHLSKQTRSVVGLFLTIGLLAAIRSAPAEAAQGPPVTVKLTILEINDDGNDDDSTSNADFYVRGSFKNGAQQPGFNNVDKRQEGQQHITPNWEFFFVADAAAGGTDINLQVLDYDAALNGNDDKVFDQWVHVDYKPCIVTGTVSGGTAINAGCGWDIPQKQSDTVRYRVEVFLPPSSPGLRIRCLQKPLLPLPGQSVTITAEALDGAAKPRPKLVDEINIEVNNANVKRVTGTSTTTYTFTPVSTPGTPIFKYRCMATNAADPDGADTWTRQVRIGRIDEIMSPAVSMGASATHIDVVLVSDARSYAAWDNPTLQNDLYDELWNGYYGNSYVLTQQNHLSIHVGHSQGTTSGFSAGTCGLTPPKDWDRYTDADVGWILHNNPLRDCAKRSLRMFGSDTADVGTVVHETGHAPFGLSDEYCCDGGYSQAATNPDVYQGRAACDADAPNVGRTAADCRLITGDWWTSDPMSADIMVDNTVFNALDIRRWNALIATCTTTQEGC
jgi:hypothetical protein